MCSITLATSSNKSKPFNGIKFPTLNNTLDEQLYCLILSNPMIGLCIASIGQFIFRYFKYIIL